MFPLLFSTYYLQATVTLSFHVQKAPVSTYPPKYCSPKQAILATRELFVHLRITEDLPKHLKYVFYNT